ncbi:MAG: hypothetical protein LBQ42_10200 [Synergistaceae bacterium]|nr:hypothetical protein [Synergistaceae bacterium]
MWNMCWTKNCRAKGLALQGIALGLAASGLAALGFIGPEFSAAWGAQTTPQETLSQETLSQETLSPQEALAREYRWAIDRTPSEDAAAREALYLRLIAECPETEAAQEAHWALSNLYLDDFDEPKEDEARRVLERFMERYPLSQWVLHVGDRLAWLWREEGR